MKSKVVALSAISAAFSAIFLTVGAYFSFADVFCVAIAAICTLLPIYYKSYLGCFLSFLAGGAIAFIASGFNILSLVFIGYFGLGAYPFLCCLLRDKGVKNIFIFIIGLIWFVGAFYGAYFYYIFVMNGVINDLPKWFTDGIYFFLPILGAITYFIFDRFVYVFRIFLNKYLKRILK